MPGILYPEVEVTNFRVRVEKSGDQRTIRANIKPVNTSPENFRRASLGCATCPLRNPDMLGQIVFYGEVIQCGGFGITRRATRVKVLTDIIPTDHSGSKFSLPGVLEGNCGFQSKPVVEAVDSGQQSVRFGPHKYSPYR